MSSGASVPTIGFMHNVAEHDVAVRPFEVHRLIPMSRVLADFGTRLLAFCPDHVDVDDGSVTGYTVGPGGFEPLSNEPVPAVSGDWYLGQNRSLRPNGLGRRGYRRWARDRGLEVYADGRLSRLLKDKLRTFALMEESAPGLHPRTEAYDGVDQLDDFLARSRRVFLKPVRGNMGNGVIVAARDRSRVRLHHYNFGRRHEHVARSTRAAVAWIESRREPRNYAIQAGVEMPRHDDGAFVIRVIMVDDGERWRLMHKAVLAPPGGDVANTTQHGSNHRVHDLLTRLYGVAAAPALQGRVEEASMVVARALDERFPGRVMELGLDLLLDADGRAHLIEANTKPGMMKPGLPKDGFPDIFDLTDEEMVTYGELISPHARYLAHFLQARLERRAAG